VKSLIDRLSGFAPVHAWRKRRYEEAFAAGSFYGYRGVYQSFAEAAASAPRTKPTGWNVPEFARSDIFAERFDRIAEHDYPVIFWLRPLLESDLTVFDFGGNVGLQFYSYERYLRYPPNLRWTVCEVPAVAEEGSRIARERGRTQLGFTTSFADAATADVLIAAGAVQYVEEPFASKLAGLPNRPRHLFLNKLPLYDGAPYVTLQNGGVHFIPQWVFNRTAFVSGFEALGYRVVDSWEDHARSTRVPFHPDLAVPVFTGLYLRQK
jgi:putative methyltransferase (TIGR04325 family)